MGTNVLEVPTASFFMVEQRMNAAGPTEILATVYIIHHHIPKNFKVWFHHDNLKFHIIKTILQIWS